MAALNAWDKVEEIGKRFELFIQVMGSPNEIFTDFLQRLTSAEDRNLSDQLAKKALIFSIQYANAECKRVVVTLKVR